MNADRQAVPVWLIALHRQWLAARGSRLSAPVVVFSREWKKLLDDANLPRAEDRAAAVREAEELFRQGRLKLVRHRYRNFILRVQLPVDQESWLRSLFATDGAADLQSRSLAIVDAFASLPHPLWPGPWAQLCHQLHSAFLAGRRLPPFTWRQPQVVQQWLTWLFALTSREWEDGTPVRIASMVMTGDTDSKAIERHRRALEAAMSLLYDRPMTLEALGLSTTVSEVRLAGPLTLHFPDGSSQTVDALKGSYAIAGTDLERASSVTTPAERLLTVENAKTTFRELAAACRDGRTLFVATSFPTQACRLLLEKLPVDLPHFHHGDTDPAGFAILMHLRRATPRPVGRCLMDWIDHDDSAPLTPFDFRWLDELERDPLMSDCQADLRRMRLAGRKGKFEQEQYGAAALAALLAVKGASLK